MDNKVNQMIKALNNKVTQSLNEDIALYDEAIETVKKEIKDKDESLINERAAVIARIKNLYANQNMEDFENVFATADTYKADLEAANKELEDFRSKEKLEMEAAIRGLERDRNKVNATLKSLGSKENALEEEKVEEPVVVTPLVEPFVGPVEINATEENTTPVPTIAFEQPNVVSEPVNVVDEDSYVKQM